MSGSTQYAVFPNSPAGRYLLYLLIPSPLISFISFILTKPFGRTSMYLIPAAFFITTMHHTVIRCLLTRKPRVTTDINSPSEARFGCLRHLISICIVGVSAALWLVGGISSIVVNVSKWSGRYSPQDIAAASFAIIEAGIVIAITVYSWKLRQESRLSWATPDIVVVDLENVPLVDNAKIKV
ncbi:unnamed protein product [Rhizoctonia solani]|uniref:Uncharacterized protein n=1 Tax=Rhizoctonia solani TaxID=456999 RepID=A0A8H2WGW0_9AGAM|nr:unnamed protein product [Rhizoctonia solani]CAE6382846.1 unnamed protein product [Rhizoctonia solani]